MKHLTMEELEAGLDKIKGSPLDGGVLEMIVCRPEVGEREVLDEGKLDLELGLLGDNWKTRGSLKSVSSPPTPTKAMGTVQNVSVPSLQFLNMAH